MILFTVSGLRPKTPVAERIATLCVLPVLLAGVLGAPSKQELLTEYLRNLLVQSAAQEGQSAMHSADIYNSVRFLWLVFPRLILVSSLLLGLDYIVSFHHCCAACLKNTRIWFSESYGKWL